ncbi:uncharacterized protein [Aegilops tauschii subsp. strangulata]|uniref:uncharacterized protein n=1 Tax=Aegilops tauschii subsp. strangulata TaxID=200361 RepID=UPI003CC89CE4
MDIGFKGRFWTFEKRVSGGSFTRVRLDRALGSTDWCSLFPFASLTHYTSASSDHGPIHLELNKSDEMRTGKSRVFHYEVAWETHEGLKEEILASWSSAEAAERIADLKEKLYNLSKSIGGWDRRTFGSVRKEMKTLKQKLEKFRNEPGRMGPS